MGSTTYICIFQYPLRKGRVFLIPTRRTSSEKRGGVKISAFYYIKKTARKYQN
jgi:hypothetical protein